MAQRRLFSPLIVQSDAFLDMPPSTQALYFQLGMAADDDGFVQPKKVMRLIGSTQDELEVLKAKRFVIPFASGIIVIKHWRIHNLIRKDRYKTTLYSTEKNLLFIKDNGAYTLLATKGQPFGNQTLPKEKLSEVKKKTRLTSKRGLSTPLIGAGKKPAVQSKGMGKIHGYNESFPPDDVGTVDADTGAVAHDKAPVGKDIRAVRVSRYFYTKAREFTGKARLVNTGYAQAKKMLQAATEEELRGVIDNYFERSPNDKDAVNIYKCLAPQTVNEYLAEL